MQMSAAAKAALGQGLCLTYGHLFNEYGRCIDCNAKKGVK